MRSPGFVVLRTVAVGKNSLTVAVDIGSIDTVGLELVEVAELG